MAVSIYGSDGYPLVSSSEHSARARGMLLAAKSFYIGGVKRYTARDYVQEGLVIQIDAIENAGYGLHQDGKKMVDLKNPEENIVFYGNANIDVDRLNIPDDTSFIKSVNAYTDALFPSNKSPRTIEFVFEKVSCGLQGPYSINGVRCAFYNKNCIMGIYGLQPPLIEGRMLTVAMDNGNATRAWWDGVIAESGWKTESVSLQSGRLIVGRNNSNREGALSDAFLGSVQAFRAYNRILSDSEVVANCDINRARFAM